MKTKRTQSMNRQTRSTLASEKPANRCGLPPLPGTVWAESGPGDFEAGIATVDRPYAPLRTVRSNEPTQGFSAPPVKTCAEFPTGLDYLGEATLNVQTVA